MPFTLDATDNSKMISGRYRELFGPLLLTGVALEALRTWLPNQQQLLSYSGGPGLDPNKGL